MKTSFEEEAKTQKKEKKQKRAGEQVPIPAGLDTPEFREAWVTWLADRKARRHPVTEAGAERQLKKLAGMNDVALAIATIEHTIEMGWTGLRQPDKGAGHGKGTAAGADRTRYRYDPARDG